MNWKNTANKFFLASAFISFVILTANAGDKSQPATAAIMVGDADEPIKKGDIEVFTKITGLPTAQDTYDIFAPFDGRVEDVLVDIFNYVTPEYLMARLASTEMAALLDSSSGMSRKETEKRWKGIYDYHLVKPQFPGVVTEVHITPGKKVYTGERLFTVAKKVVIIGKNTEPLYSKLAPGMTAEVAYVKDDTVKLKGALTNFMRLKDSPYFNRLWIDVTTLRDGIKIGEQFDGYLYIGKSENTLLVPRKAIFEKFGRKYLIMSVETGLATEEETEILRPGLNFIMPKYQPTEKADGKNKKTN